MTIQTSNLEAAETMLEWYPTVRDARVVDHEEDSVPRMLEIVLERNVDRVPPGVLRELAKHDCGVATVQQQGDYLVAEVR